MEYPAWEDVPLVDRRLFTVVCKLVRAMPQMILDHQTGHRFPLDCHLLAGGLAVVLPNLLVYSAVLFGLFEHSWLMTADGSLIDSWPVGIANGPLLIPPDSPMIDLLYSNPGLLHRDLPLRADKIFLRLRDQVAATLRVVAVGIGVELDLTSDRL